MTGLILLLAVGTLLIVFFAIALLFGRPGKQEDPAASRALTEIVSLPGLGFRNAGMLFDDSDYRALRRVPALKQVARQLRADRRRLVLLWLKLLAEDLLKLWRFRRLLASYGVSQGTLEELRVGMTAIFALALLSSLRITMSVAGPFFLTGILRNARFLVDTVSRSCASLLGRIPSARWNEIQNAWSAGPAS